MRVYVITGGKLNMNYIQVIKEVAIKALFTEEGARDKIRVIYNPNHIRVIFNPFMLTEH